RVAEHARGDGLRTHVALFRPGLRRLGEVEPFELDAAHRHDTELFGALQYPLQKLPRADGKRNLLAVLLSDELAEEKRHVVVPWHVAVRAEIDARDRVGKALVPAGQGRVVVAMIVHVPA